VDYSKRIFLSYCISMLPNIDIKTRELLLQLSRCEYVVERWTVVVYIICWWTLVSLDHSGRIWLSSCMSMLSCKTLRTWQLSIHHSRYECVIDTDDTVIHFIGTWIIVLPKYSRLILGSSCIYIVSCKHTNTLVLVTTPIQKGIWHCELITLLFM
jgi:hypothetical protein